MRSLAALMIATSLFAAAKASPVVAALLRSLTAEQAASLGAAPSVATVARAVPSDKRSNAAASLRPLEAGAAPATLTELTRAYLYLAQPADADRVSRLAAAAMPGADGHAFRAWAAAQAGDNAAAASAAREALRLSPGRRDALAILKLTEGREKGTARPDSALEGPVAAPASKPLAEKTRAIGRHEQGRAGLRLLGEAIRARDMGDRVRALELARKAAAADPSSPEPAQFLKQLEDGQAPIAVRDGPYTDPVVIDTLRTMRLSPVGKEIADFLVAHKVDIVVSDSLPEGAIAMYAPNQDTIFIPSAFAKEPAIVRALVMGHEGHHAMQDLKYRSAVTLETELDSSIRGLAVYRELREAGIAGIPPIHELRGLAGAFDRAVDADELREFKAMLADMYTLNARGRQNAQLSKAPAYAHAIARPVLEALPPYHNATFARSLKENFWGRLFAGRRKIETAQLQHAEEIRWMNQWRKQRP